MWYRELASEYSRGSEGSCSPPSGLTLPASSHNPPEQSQVQGCLVQMRIMTPGGQMELKITEKMVHKVHTLTQHPPLSIPDTRDVHILDLSGELPDALGQIFDSQQGCDLFIQVTGQGHGDLSFCAHTLILRTNPEAQALWQVVGSSVVMRVDAECMAVVRDFLR